jgi:uncharacterized protein YaaN involved in tellurite resistance
VDELMEKAKEELRKSLAKAELLEALEESFKLQERLYDGNLERMADLQQQIEAIKYNNNTIHKKMREFADKIHELKAL